MQNNELIKYPHIIMNHLQELIDDQFEQRNMSQFLYYATLFQPELIVFPVYAGSHRDKAYQIREDIQSNIDHRRKCSFWIGRTQTKLEPIRVELIEQLSTRGIPSTTYIVNVEGYRYG